MITPRIALIALYLASTHAFVTKSTTSLRWNCQELYSETSYGEESRKYRRTVYTHDDWVNHRSPDRFLRNIGTTFNSGIYKNVGREVTAVVAVAILVMLWNMATAGYTDFAGVDHEAIWKSVFTPALSVPMQAFTLPSSFLGLLLGKDDMFLVKLSLFEFYKVLIHCITIHPCSLSNQRCLQTMG
jgi:hypothetical protein